MSACRPHRIPLIARIPLWITCLVSCAWVGMLTRPAGAESVDDFLASIRDKPPKERVEALRDYTDSHKKTTREVWFTLGNAYYETNDTGAAIGAFQKAIEIDPNYFKAMVNLALSYDTERQYDTAIEVFERAAAIDSTNADLWSHWGNTYYSKNEYGKGMAYYRKALALDPNAAHALYSIGVAFADAGMFREAVNYWTRVSQLEQDSELGRNAAENVELLLKYLVPHDD